MDTLKLTLILCVAVFYTCAQVPELQPVDVASEHQLENAADDARKLLAQLEALINNTITDALSTVDSLLDQLNQTAIAIEEKAEEAFNATIKPFLEAIDDLKKKAAAAAVDISDCVGDSEEVISSLPKEFLKNVTECTNSKLTEAKKYVDKAVKDCQSVLVVISDLGDEIEVCSKKMIFEQIVCFTKVTADITANLVSLPLKITTDVEQAKIYFAAAIPAIALCDSGVVEKIGKEGAAITATVTECAIKKINGKSTTEEPLSTTSTPTKKTTEEPLSTTSTPTKKTTEEPLSTTSTKRTTEEPLSTTSTKRTTEEPLSTTSTKRTTEEPLSTTSTKITTEEPLSTTKNQ